ncbi:hypothetical protein PsorP6_012514 [Peronosclerospora sorghi]|uniref:Uncharacterized protein n=1 Tax=Peronosclerospora sorghi TaxID=230839 RepID=A0ACC0WHN7_9STRA|nr:hypothetical protein PsorP6_012514 [Peronosclerospora sorghi]
MPDVSHNRILNFSAAVFDPIQSTIKSIHLDSNRLTSIPSTNFLALVKTLVTNITLRENPGIGWSFNGTLRPVCPNGSVFQELPVSSATLAGCIQCAAGFFHDHAQATCVACTHVSARGYSEDDGAVTCRYCPYSSDLAPARTLCHAFECTLFCWLTLALGVAIPSVIVGSKVLLACRGPRSLPLDIHEQETLNDWRMATMLDQLARPRTSASDLLLEETDEGHESQERDALPVCIYDLPDETKDLVLSTLHEYFQIRKEKRWRALAPAQQDAKRAWHHVEWATVHMHRLLHRTSHGELFLGEYRCHLVVVKRLKTLSFHVQELAETLKDVELMQCLDHPHLVACLGTTWAEPAHLNVLSEYVDGGDLAAVLEVERRSRPHFSLSAASLARDALVARFQLVRDLCHALTYVHGLGLAHRDVRSRTVLVTDTFRCKLDDVRHHGGKSATYHAVYLALVDDDDDEDARPRAPHRVSLVAPELVRHEARALDRAAADMYSVGIVLLELWFHAYLAYPVDPVPVASEQVTVPRFLSKLRLVATARSEQDADMCSFGTTPTSSAASWTLSRASSTTVVDTVTRLVHECLAPNPVQRPRATHVLAVCERVLNELHASRA